MCKKRGNTYVHVWMHVGMSPEPEPRQLSDQNQDEDFDFIGVEELLTHQPILSLRSLDPYYNEDGTRIDGLFFHLVDDDSDPKTAPKLVLFTDSQTAALNDVTVAAVAAALQGGKSIPGASLTENRPLPYARLLYTNLNDYLRNGAQAVLETPWTNQNKIIEYRRIGALLNEACRLNPYAFWTAASQSGSRSNQFGVLPLFFPNFSENLLKGVPLERILRNNITKRYPNLDTVVKRMISGQNAEKASIVDVLRAYTRTETMHVLQENMSLREHIKLVYALVKIANLGYFPQSQDELMELAILTNQSPETIELLIQPESDELVSLMKSIPWDQPRDALKTSLLQKIETESKEKYRKDLMQITEVPNPEDYGLVVDAVRSEIMQEHYDPNAIVLSVESIRNNHDGYYRYQRDLARYVAWTLGVNPFDKNSFSFIRNPNDRQDPRINSLEQHLQMFKDKSEWLWLLMNEKIFQEWMARLPYSGIPPFTLYNDEWIPVHKAGERLTPDIGYQNDLPFLNHVRTVLSMRKAGDYLKADLSVPGYFLSNLHEQGGWAFIDHAIARLYLMGHIFNENDFAPEYAKENLRFDTDILVFGNVDPGSIAYITAEMLNKMGFIQGKEYGWSGFSGGTMHGISMGAKIAYGYLAYPIATFRDSLNPYIASHSNRCAIQAIGAWAGEFTDFSTNKLVEAMTALSGFRSMGIVPVPFNVGQGRWDRNEYQFAAKVVLPVMGIADFAEAGGGVQYNDIQRNRIRFISSKDSFPIQIANNNRGALNDWHTIRTANDLLRPPGGVLYPDGIPIEHDREDDDVLIKIKQGSEQFRTIVIESANLIPSLIERFYSSNQGLQLTDLRFELESGAKEAMDYDPYHFLILCSGKEHGDRDRGLFGVELSRYYPHLHILRQNGNIWRELLSRTRYETRFADETGSHFIARQILAIPDTIPLLGDTLLREFLADPYRFKSILRIRRENENPDFPQQRGWAILHPILFGHMRYPDAFTKFLEIFKDHKASLSDWSQIVEFMNISHAVSHRSKRHGTVERRLFGRKAQINAIKFADEWQDELAKRSPRFMDRLTNAVADFLPNPGF